MVVSGLRFSDHIPVCLQCSDSRTGGFVAVTVVVLSSEIAAPFLFKTVVYSATANFGMLTSAKCSPVTMFISRVARRRLCLRSIFFVAFTVRPSGNMNVFWDDCLVPSGSGAFSSGAAQEVALESRKANLLDFLFCSFRAQCATTLFDGTPLAIANMAISMLVVLPDDDFSCSLTGRQMGTSSLRCIV
jgi:hypothetical protein